MANKFKQHYLSLAIQAAHLRKLFPESEVYVRSNQLRWLGELRPTAFSKCYQVSINYSLETRPKVRVVNPKLQLPPSLSSVHMFADETLCLYLPRSWNGSMILAETVVPWTSEWLLHYEVWQVTGKWCGGGVHPHTKTPSTDAA